MCARGEGVRNLVAQRASTDSTKQTKTTGKMRTHVNAYIQQSRLYTRFDADVDTCTIETYFGVKRKYLCEGDNQKNEALFALGTRAAYRNRPTPLHEQDKKRGKKMDRCIRRT